jgi:small-conductance mechanosensitive channel
MRKGWMLGIGIGMMLAAHAQTPAADALPVERNLAALKAVADPLSEAIAEVAALSAELKTADSEERRQELTARLEAERERVRQLRGNFRDIVGGSEAAEYEGQVVEEEGAGLQEQMSDLLQPLLGALREPTSRMREMEDMRQRLEDAMSRKAKADRVLERIRNLEEKAEDERVRAELATARRLWEGRQAESGGQVEVLSVQVEERERLTPTFWQSMTSMLKGFWKTRGLNVLLAIAVAVLAYLGVRRLYHWLRRMPPLRRKGRASLIGRASDILSVMVAVLMSIIGVLMVFYIRGDWLLLTLAAVLLISAVWAGKTALPPYIDQIRMLLNLGPVREGERLIYRDLPWQVRSLGFYSVFHNPALEGGELRVPMRELMTMVSRDADPKEPWFPSQADDWVLLEGGDYGKVIRQTPEQVVVLKLGGSLKTFPTSEFLERNPENLSRGFRVCSVFGIDYTHQAISTGKVLQVFADALQDAFYGEFGRDPVRSVKVEFKAAADSSLDYEILADFDGELASRYNQIARIIQRVCVDVCNELGWVIPFTQVTVHQAGAPENQTPREGGGIT